MFGSKSRTRKAELAAAEADQAAQVAAEKALAAQEAQEAAREEIRERKRAEREQALAEAREKAQGLWSEAQSKAAEAKEKAQTRGLEAKDRTRAKLAETSGETSAGRAKAAALLGFTGASASDTTSRAKDRAAEAASYGKAGLFGLVGAARGAGEDLSGRRPELTSAAASRLSDARDRAAEVADRARDAYRGSDGVQNAKDNLGVAAGRAREWAGPHLEAARDRGLGLASPAVENAASSLQPRVSAVQTKVVDDFLPRISEAVSAATAAAAAKTDEAADDSRSRLEVVSKRAKRQTKAAKSAPSHRELVKAQKAQADTNRHPFLLLSAITAGGVAAYAAWRSNQPSQDPWAVATAATQPTSTATQGSAMTTTTAATPQHDASAPTTGPMVADGSVTVDNTVPATAPGPQAAGFGVDTEVTDGTVADVRPQVAPAPQHDLTAGGTLGRDDTQVDIQRDLSSTDLPQRAPVQAREPFANEGQSEPFGQETQTGQEQYYPGDPQRTENVQVDDDALQQFRRHRDVLPGQEDNR